MRALYSLLILLVFWNASFVNASVDSDMLLFETVTANNVSLNSRIYTILNDPRGFIWLGTDAGLLRYDGYSSIRVQTNNPDHSLILATAGIEVLATGSDSTLWIGTSQGLINLNLNTWESTRPGIFQNNTIRTLLFQSDTCVWIGTNHGLYSYNPVIKQAVYYSQINSGLSQNVIRALFMDSNGNLWVGTADKLNVLFAEKTSFESFDLKGNYKPNIKHVF